jgi:hypothetical protein
VCVRQDSVEVASVAAEPAAADAELVVATFQIPRSEYAAFEEREAFFRLTPVAVVPHPDHPWTAEEDAAHAAAPTCALCVRFASEAELVATNFASQAAFDARVRPWYSGAIFRRDIRPCRVYLKHCLVAAERLGPAALANFLATSFLADGNTSVGAYLAAHPSLLDGVVLGQFARYHG